MLYNAWICERCRTDFSARRAGAFLIDVIVSFILAILLVETVALPFSWREPEGAVALLCCVLLLLKDGVAGRSPGKRLAGLRVLSGDARQPAGFKDSLKRNIILLIPGLILVESLLVILGTRLGDQLAGTEVIRQLHANRYPFHQPARYCIGCGYNLTGNASGRCPECGMEIPSATRRLLARRSPGALT